MTMNTKKLNAIISAGLLISLLFLPQAGFAKPDKNTGTAAGSASPAVKGEKNQKPGEKPDNEKSGKPKNDKNDKALQTAEAEKGFCAKLPETAEKIRQRLSEKKQALAAMRSAYNSAMEIKRSQRDEKLLAERAEADGAKEKKYAKLENKAATPQQKQAVKNFEAAVDRAVKERRAKVTAAIAAFRSSLDAAIARHKTQIDQATQNFSGALTSALAHQAQADCNRNLEDSLARQRFDAALKTAQAKFESDRQAFEGTEKEIEQLAQIKAGAIEKAAKEFKKAIEKAKKDLKSAFKK